MNGGRMRAALALLSLLAVTACTADGDQPEAAPSPSESPSATSSWFPSPTPTPSEPFEVKNGSQAAARSLLRRGFDLLLRADHGGYDVRAERQPGQETFYSEVGSYSLFDRSFEMARHYREGGMTGVPEFTLTMRSVGRQRFLQMDQWRGPLAGCWMAFDTKTLKEKQGIAGYQLPPYPLPILMVGATRVVGMSAQDENVVRVTVPTVTAMQMLGLTAARVSALKVPWSLRTEATVTLVAGHLAEMRVEGITTLLDLKDLELNPLEYSLIGDASATASFYEVDEPVLIEVPDDDLVVANEEEAEQGCNANLPDA
ncbi:MAG TPA: hypothetical protein VFK52_03070 [Nocardioidaceae bacterium]|nr:hypothetical protein [Nocardioidaceae bacterium]